VVDVLIVKSILVLLGVVACGDQAHFSSLVATVAEAPGAHCAAGGEAIESGLDRDNNGVLDASEVTSTSYVCSAAPGATTLVDVVIEPAGSHCANGGQAVESGIDTNGNGVLDASEVTETSYVCSGANGAEPLIRIDSEPAGSHCTAGGSAISVGVDTNDDGVLEDSEIQSTSYVCRAATSAVIDGSFIVNNSVDAAQLVGVTTITGDLTVDAAGLESVDFSSLQTLGGTLYDKGFSGTVLAFPALTSAAGLSVISPIATPPIELPVLATVGNIVIQQHTFTSLSFPALTSMGAFSVNGSTLTTLSMPVLTTATGVSISNTGLSSLDFSNVTVTGSVTISNSSNLTSLSLHATSLTSLFLVSIPVTSIDLSSLTQVTQNLYIDDMPNLTSIDFTSLATVGSWMYIENNPALDTLAFPALTSVASTVSSGLGFGIINNAVLSSFSAPVWTSFGPTPYTPNCQLEVYQNPHLPSCEIHAVVDPMNAPGAIFSNDDGATCP
jgi:hypothetical protein